jgi:hypothetical protein
MDYAENCKPENSLRFVRQRNINSSSGGLGIWENIEVELGFRVVRFFVINEVPAGVSRGGHAHFECIQAIACLSGCVDIKIERQNKVLKHTLRFSDGLLVVPPLSWLELTRFSDFTTTLIVFASHEYSENDYIRNYDKFKFLVR